MARLVGLDLGTFYTRIWTQEQGIVLRCPSAAAINSHTHEVVALGGQACRMIGKTPEDILAYRPIRDGVITDFDVASRMVSGFFDAKRICTLFQRPMVLISAPYHINQVQQLAAENAILEAGAKAVAQVPAAYAAAVGEGLRVLSRNAHLVLSVGAGLSESVVISGGGIIHAKSLRVAGERFDMAIVSYIKNRYGLVIGESTAEEVKLRIGTADPTVDRGSMEVRGRNVRTGLAESRRLTSADICDAITPAVNAIANMMLATIEESPPEIATELYAMGALLTGGSSLLPGFRQALARKTGLRVIAAREPMDNVIKGLGRMALHPELVASGLDFHKR